MAEDRQVEQKKHAACDDCRTRKLKCSGEIPTCQRCQVEGLLCVYSLRKKMGRPRKRARDDGEMREGNGNNSFEEGSSFDFNSIMPAHIVGIPGTGVPLRLGTELSASTFGSPPSTSLTWLDPLLQNTSTAQSQGGMFSKAPFMSMAEFTASSSTQSSDSTSHQTPPQLLVPDIAAPNTCLCLQNMYLTLSDVSASKDWVFPFSLHKLKLALQMSESVLKCEVCPHDSTSAMQNLMMLTTLLTTITDCYRKVLNAIDAEAANAEAGGTSIRYRMGDTNPERWHLHTGTDDCPMGINVDLEPVEYKMLARKVVKADVCGATASARPASLSILGLVAQLEDRQREWHASAHSAEMRAHWASGGQACRPEDGDYTCLKMISTIRRHVELMRL